jgi:hypothetical protein
MAAMHLKIAIVAVLLPAVAAATGGIGVAGVASPTLDIDGLADSNTDTSDNVNDKIPRPSTSNKPEPPDPTKASEAAALKSVSSKKNTSKKKASSKTNKKSTNTNTKSGDGSSTSGSSTSSTSVSHPKITWGQSPDKLYLTIYSAQCGFQPESTAPDWVSLGEWNAGKGRGKPKEASAGKSGSDTSSSSITTSSDNSDDSEVSVDSESSDSTAKPDGFGRPEITVGPRKVKFSCEGE